MSKRRAVILSVVLEGRSQAETAKEWVASDFARQILSFSTLYRAGLVVLEKEAAPDGFSAKKLQEVFD